MRQAGFEKKKQKTDVDRSAVAADDLAIASDNLHMKSRALALFLSLAIADPAFALTPPAPPPPTSKLMFLLGDWDIHRGKVEGIDRTFVGHSTATAEASGNGILIREDREIYDGAGKYIGKSSTIMLLYSRNWQTVEADDVQPNGVTHYISGQILPTNQFTPANELVLTSSGPGQPDFRLEYDMLDGNTIIVKFSGRAGKASMYEPFESWALIRRHPTTP